MNERKAMTKRRWSHCPACTQWRPHHAVQPAPRAPDPLQIRQAIRCTERERLAAVDRLQDALAEGSLGPDVFKARLDAALASVTQDELRQLASDLPRPSEPPLVPVKARSPKGLVKLGAAAIAYLLFTAGLSLLLVFGAIGGGFGNHPHGAAEVEAVLGLIAGLIWPAASLVIWCAGGPDGRTSIAAGTTGTDGDTPDQIHKAVAQPFVQAH